MILDTVYCIVSPENEYEIRIPLDECQVTLITVAVSPESQEALREVAVDAVMEFVKLGNGGRFQTAIYHRLLHTVYIDVRYFTYISLEKIVKSLELTNNSDNGDVPAQNKGESISRQRNFSLGSRYPPPPYCPAVSRFVVSLENNLTIRAKTTEVDIRRRMKQVPLAIYKSTPTSLFSESDFAGWTFNAKESEDQKLKVAHLTYDILNNEN
ncbi:hypothetical protein NE237_019232 [Protea cynaroides]|uniref:Uncharacterized protein n=1 Tax=Protea cynaroides TaxID=273540 RepID=A0A9Q0KBC0_9MAGN|nr:hypothetical protein NE237_019232 [Protea cynaroides]